MNTQKKTFLPIILIIVAVLLYSCIASSSSTTSSSTSTSKPKCAVCGKEATSQMTWDHEWYCQKHYADAWNWYNEQSNKK